MKNEEISEILALFVSAVGVLVMTGWALDIAILKSIHPHWVTMKFSTALCFFLAGLSLFSLSKAIFGNKWYAQLFLPAVTFSGIVLMVILLISSLMGVRTGVEDLFVRESASAVMTTTPGRPSIGTMIAFILVALCGLSAIFVSKHVKSTLFWNGSFIGSLGIVALVGYLLNIPLLYYSVPKISTAMAIHTAILFVILATELILISKSKTDFGTIRVSIRSKIRMAFALFLVLLVFLATLTVIQHERLEREYIYIVEHDALVCSKANEMLKLVIDMETGERGYIITNDESFLEPYVAAITHFDDLMREEKLLVRDNPAQLRRLKKIEYLLYDWKERAAKPAIAARASSAGDLSRVEGVVELVRAKTGKHIFDELRAEFDLFIQIERNLTDGRFQTASRNSRQARDLFIVITIILLLTIPTLLWFVTRAAIDPLYKLGRFAEKVGKGQMNFEIDHLSQDEVGDLIRRFVEMAENVSKSREDLIGARDYVDSVIRSLPDLLFVFDDKWKIKTSNAAAQRILGYSFNEFIELGIENILEDPGDLIAIQRIIEEENSNTTIFGKEIAVNYLTRTKQTVPVRVSLSLIKDEPGVRTGVICVARDMRETLRLEEKFRLLFETSPTGLLFVNRSGNIVQANAEAERILGIEHGGLFGKAVDAFLPGKFREIHKDLRENFHSDPSPQTLGLSENMFALKNGGGQVPVEITLAPLKATDDEQIVAISITDVTERRKVERSLAVSERDAATGRLSAMVAHQVNNPLAAMDVRVDQLMEMFDSDPEAVKSIGVLKRGVDRISRTISALLGYSRQRNIDQKTFEPSKILNNVCILFYESLKSQGIDLTTDIPETLPELMGDPSDFQEIIVNLLENARQVSEISTISIRCEDRKKEIEIIVEDNGTGLGEDPNILFEPYYTTKLHGTGIGLSIAKAACRAQGGDLLAENWYTENEDGARFRIILKKANAE